MDATIFYVAACEVGKSIRLARFQGCLIITAMLALEGYSSAHLHSTNHQNCLPSRLNRGEIHRFAYRKNLA
jgi:hypothetical protein